MTNKNTDEIDKSIEQFCEYHNFDGVLLFALDSEQNSHLIIKNLSNSDVATACMRAQHLLFAMYSDRNLGKK